MTCEVGSADQVMRQRRGADGDRGGGPGYSSEILSDVRLQGLGSQQTLRSGYR
jgi:hypothetical protein